MIENDPRLDGLIVSVSRMFESSTLFYGHGAGGPNDEAKLLVLGAMQSRLDWTWREFKELILSLVERRISDRKPTVYLTEEAWYCGRWFITPPGIMIPRSPIFELIESEFRPWLRNPPLRILDLCCGGGCLGISAALAFPNAALTLSDSDSAALKCARANVDRYDLGSRATIVSSDLCDSIPSEPFDLVISNPPYVPKQEYDSLPAEYHYEPRGGLVSGNDGLEAWRQILLDAPSLMSADALLVGEVCSTSTEFERNFPLLEVIWPELTQMERLFDGSFGVFIAEREALRVSS